VAEGWGAQGGGGGGVGTGMGRFVTLPFLNNAVATGRAWHTELNVIGMPVPFAKEPLRLTSQLHSK